MAIRQDFESFIGEDIRLRTTLTPTTDILGYTFEFTARTDVLATGKFLEKLNASFTIEDADAGIFYTNITDAETDIATPTADTVVYDYSIKRMDSGLEAVLVWGTWTLRAPATRDND